MIRLADVAEEIRAKQKALRRSRVLVGFDATVDKIVEAVDKRLGLGEAYAPIPSITAFGGRVSAAAHKSTNIELFQKREKIGGNAAIMAGALASLGARPTLLADLGQKKLHPVFKPLRKKAQLKRLGDPTETHALEFSDGKIMFCYTRNHEAITFTNIRRKLGVAFKPTFRRAQLVSLVNWTMTPGMTEILRRLAREVLEPLSGQTFFFDLADPEKRPTSELREVLELLPTFERFGPVILGLNLKEAVQVCEVLHVGLVSEESEALQKTAQALREKLNIHCVIIHPSDFAVCATLEGAFFAQGPFIKAPKIKTGAGDHFNAGFAAGVLMGLGTQGALTLGVAASGYYVAEGKTPSLNEIIASLSAGW